MVCIQPAFEGAEFGAQSLDPPGVFDHRVDLQPVADDPGIIQQAPHILIAIGGYCIHLEAFEGYLKMVFTLQDQGPGETGLVDLMRQPFQQGDLLPYWAMGNFSGNHLYKLSDDPLEERNLASPDSAATTAEKNATDELRAALDEIEAPKDQYLRLGLA